ncbi:hypothetical protein BDF22DRAFT_689649 [Syncephalis plumigaleata]|nr:hypothetical protein BDF22DRAFT_689649 [Syncephalis plumigaleata]
MNNNTRICQLPSDVLCHVFIQLGADDLIAVERTCLRLRRLLVDLGWRIWLRYMGWQFNSCPITRLRVYTLPHSTRYRSDTGPSYLARIGSITDKRWREHQPSSHLLDQHAQVSGPVVRADAWTVGNQVRWTNATCQQWPVSALHQTHSLQAHESDLTDLILNEDTIQQAHITVASVDGSIARWRIGTSINKHRATAASSSSSSVLESINMNQVSISRREQSNRHAQLEWRMSRVNDVPHRIIAVSHDLKLRVIDSERQTIAMGHRMVANDVVAVGLFGYPNSLAVYRLRPDTVVLDRFLPGHRSSVYGLDSCPLAPSLLLSGGYEGQTRLWDLRMASRCTSYLTNNRACVGVFEDRFNDSAIYCCQWDGQRIASGRGHHGIISFWDARWSTLTTQCQSVLLDYDHVGSGGSGSYIQRPLRYIDTWSKYNGNRWTPVYSLCLEQTRVLAALDTELWWLNFIDNTLTLPLTHQPTAALKHAKPSRSRRKRVRQPRP